MSPTHRLAALITFVLVVATCGIAAATEVTLDPTFSSDGKVFVAEKDSVAGSVALDGSSMYVAGSVGSNRVFVTRVDGSGTLDATFSGDGIARLRIPGKYPFTGLAVDGLGRPVLVAESTDKTVVARFARSGELDHSFSGDGIRLFSGGAQAQYFDPDVVIDSAGRIVMAAMVNLGAGKADVRIHRLLPGGLLDSTWSGDGLKTINAGAQDWMDALAVDDQDRVLLGSDLAKSSPALVYRFRANGSTDSSFSGDGVAHFRFQPRVDTFPLRLGATGNGSITVAAASISGGSYGVARLLSDGRLDPAFADGGILALSCMECFPTLADVDNGRTAIAFDPAGYSGAIRVVQTSGNGRVIDYQSVDVYPDPAQARTFAIELDGSRTLLAGSAHKRAFAARIP